MTISPETRAPDSPGGVPVGRRSAQATVARNTAFLLVAQVLGMPLTLAMNAVMARRLGPSEFGYIYLAGTLVGLGFLVVEWGQSGALPSMIATNHSLASRLLGAGLAWRMAASVVMYGVLVLTSKALGYGDAFQKVLFLVVLARVVGTVCAACLDTASGLEHSALTAYSSVRYNLLCAGLVIPTLLLGGRLFGALLALFAADVINTAFVWRGSRRLGIVRLSVSRNMLQSLLSRGTSFMLLNLALGLQPNVDAVFLSRLGTPEAMGWYAAARKLVGVLVFPVVALQGALYPTLCRLFAEDPTSYRKMTGTALRICAILVVPLALGAALYPELGIRIFSEASFGPAADDLRVLSVFILLLYFTMILGSAIAASGRQRAWTAAQFACVAVSATADPLLIPWFQLRVRNGGLGLCVSTVLSEILMITFGFLIAPRGLLDRQLLLSLGRALIAGGGMAAASRMMSFSSPFLGAAVGVVSYGACLWAVGGVDHDALQMVRSVLARKAARRPA